MKAALKNRTITFQPHKDTRELLRASMRKAEFNRRGGMSLLINEAIRSALAVKVEESRNRYTVRKIKESQ